MPAWVLISAIALGWLWLVGESAAPAANTALLDVCKPWQLGRRTVELTRQLIACQPVSPVDGGCQTLMIDRLALRSASRWRACASGQSIISGPSVARSRSGVLLSPAIPTSCHSGPADEWRSDPFEPVVRRRPALWARRGRYEKRSSRNGHRLQRQFVGQYPQHRGTIAFLITSDEEGPSVDGTRRVVEVLQ